MHCNDSQPGHVHPNDDVRKELGLGIDVCGIHVVRSAARFRVSSRSVKLAEGLAKIQAARNSLLVTLPDWDRTWLHRTMTYATMSAHNHVRRMVVT